MDPLALLPPLAFAAGLAWPAARRALTVASGRRTLANSTRRVLAP